MPEKYIYLILGAVIPLIIVIIQFISYKRKINKNTQSIKILDTSAVIDGRIADVCEGGFMEGTIILPRFILQELQYIADSGDNLKRSKGRRGLDVINALKKCQDIEVKIIDKDFPDIKKVDEKLVALAKEFKAKIITNDYNLNKVAEIQNIRVLNINDLSNAIKPIFLPGERINIKIMKEGKEKDQGVAYLNDGTMIVVDNARRFIGKRIEATVTNILQTDAGRLIFAKFEGNRR